MAIKKIESPTSVTPTEQKIYLEIDNGDLEAINLVIDKYKFIDIQGLLRFALFVLLNAEKNAVYVDQGEKRVKLEPDNSITKQVENSSS